MVQKLQHFDMSSIRNPQAYLTAVDHYIGLGCDDTSPTGLPSLILSSDRLNEENAAVRMSDTSDMRKQRYDPEGSGTMPSRGGGDLIRKGAIQNHKDSMMTIEL